MEQKKNINFFYYKLDDGLYAFTIVDDQYNLLYSNNHTTKEVKILTRMFKDKKFALIYFDSDEYRDIVKLILERT